MEDWKEKYFESRITELEKQIIVRLDLKDVALKLQAEENHRRLEILNGEQARLALDRARFVSGEIYGPAMNNIDIRLKALELTKANVEGKSVIISSVVSIAISILVVFITNYFKG